MAYDVDRARASGLSDEEIAGYLARKYKFNYEGFRRAGGSATDAVTYLQKKSVVAESDPYEAQLRASVMRPDAPPSLYQRVGKGAAGFVEGVRNQTEQDLRLRGIVPGQMPTLAQAQAGVHGAISGFQDPRSKMQIVQSATRGIPDLPQQFKVPSAFDPVGA